jgi:hypothetical protein
VRFDRTKYHGRYSRRMVETGGTTGNAAGRGGARKGAAGGVTGATVFFLLNGVFVPPERYEAFAKWEEAERSA